MPGNIAKRLPYTDRHKIIIRKKNWIIIVAKHMVYYGTKLITFTYTFKHLSQVAVNHCALSVGL